MRRTLGWGLVLVVLGSPAARAADKDKEKKDDPPASASYVSAGDVSGSLHEVKLSDGAGSITVRLASVGIKGKRLAEVQKDLTLEVTGDFKIRIQHLPPRTDDKGKKIARTAEELQKLRGNGNLPGYAAEAGDLRTGQIVQVHLAKMKGATGADAKLYASRILIVSEPPAPPQLKDAKKDKK